MMKHILIITGMILSLGSCSQVNHSTVEDYFKELAIQNKYSGNVLVMHKDSVVYEKSIGYASGNKKQILDKKHHFQVGSIYKEFPAVAIMLLIESGQLSLEDKLSQHILDLPSWSDKVTIENLLQYSSGLPNIDWESMFQSKELVTLDNALEKLQSIKNLEFNPGSNYIYSNYNPFLLIKIIESVTNFSFHDYLENNILKPYNLKEITLTSKYPYPKTSVQKFAYPFDEDFNDDDMEYELPSICATSKGIYNWFKLLDDFKIISKESMQLLSKEAIEGDNIQSPIGRGDWVDNNLILHLHHGSTGNYECLVRNYKNENISIILLTNRKQRNLHEIADKIKSILDK